MRLCSTFWRTPLFPSCVLLYRHHLLYTKFSLPERIFEYLIKKIFEKVSPNEVFLKSLQS